MGLAGVVGEEEFTFEVVLPEEPIVQRCVQGDVNSERASGVVIVTKRYTTKFSRIP